LLYFLCWLQCAVAIPSSGCYALCCTIALFFVLVSVCRCHTIWLLCCVLYNCFIFCAGFSVPLPYHLLAVMLCAVQLLYFLCWFQCAVVIPSSGCYALCCTIALFFVLASVCRCHTIFRLLCSVLYNCFRECVHYFFPNVMLYLLS